MNPIATQALASALGKALAASLPNVPPPQTFADVLVQLDLNDIDTSGPINQVMFREGQAFALDMVRSAGRTIADPKLAARLVQNLIRSALGRPPSYALGIKKIIELMQVKP